MRSIARIERWLLFEDEAARELPSRRGKIVRDSSAAARNDRRNPAHLVCSPRRIRPAADRAKQGHLLLFYWCDLVGRRLRRPGSAERRPTNPRSLHSSTQLGMTAKLSQPIRLPPGHPVFPGDLSIHAQFMLHHLIKRELGARQLQAVLCPAGGQFPVAD